MSENISDSYQYTGFWARVGASLIDTFIIMIIIYPLMYVIYGRDYFTRTALVSGPADVFISWVMPIVGIILFWMYRQATPGKMAISAKLVDAKTGGKPSTQQLIIRYLGYFVATLPLCLGFIWIAWDPKKQGWHDKMAGTVVINPKHRTTQAVQFDATPKAKNDADKRSI